MPSRLVRMTQALRTPPVLVLAAAVLLGCPSPAPPPQLPAPEFEPARPLDAPASQVDEPEALSSPLAPPSEQPPPILDAGVTDAEPEAGQAPPAS